MNSITVKVNDLWSVLNLMKKEGMSQVNLTLCEADEEEPAFINFEAVSQNAPECFVDYDSVDAVPEDELLIES